MKNVNAFELTKNKKLFLLDMDGTVYHGDVPIPGATDFIKSLCRTGADYIFMTNNSSKSADAYLEKLHRLGFPAENKNILTSGQTAAVFLCKKKEHAAVYVMGTSSLRRELASYGLDVRTEPDKDIDFLLVGYDTELTYKKMEDSCELICRGVPFFATNPDVVCPAPNGRYLPDCATMCYCLEKATGKTPFYIGKPRPEMPLAALSVFGVDKKDAVVVGDRLYTDIKCGVNAGIDTVLVLSGESTVADIEKFGVMPTAVAESVREMIR